jgi:hypothetical protein
MKLSPLLPLLFVGGALAIGEARAMPLYFDLSGTFDANAPTTSVSAPNTTFDLTFSLPDNFASSPSYYQYDLGNWFLVQPQISYTLGNNAAIAITYNTVASPGVYLLNPSFDGSDFQVGLPFDSTEIVDFVFSNPTPLYSGPEYDPKIETGTFTSPSAITWLYQNNAWGPEFAANEKLSISTSPFVSSVPDGASTMALLGMGCLGMVLVGKLRKPMIAQP